MKEIKLTKGQVALVDDSDFEYLNQWKWCARKHRNTFYAQRSLPRVNGKQETVQMHRFILGLTDPKVLTDHKDWNGLNNQRSNLRVATVSQNNANKKPKGTSKYMGVSLLSRDNVWVANLYKNGKHYWLGRYNTEKEAALAYDEAAKKYHGEFANINFL